MKRRDFLKRSGCLAAGAVALAGRPRASAKTGGPERFVREASWYKRLAQRQVECTLCPRHCQVADQETGWCGVRSNSGGTYHTHVYGRPVTIHDDPIEKKPLFHFRPGTKALSLSTAGCNFECQFCQNWELSQFRAEQVPARYGFVAPEQLVSAAKQRGSRSIAFTYGEPVVFYEYMLDIARAAKPMDVPGVMITNGYIDPAPMEELLKVLGAVKVDFKAFSERFYEKWCRGTLKPVLEIMKRIRQRGVWLEMVHLTIPTLNDSEDEIKALCEWVLANLGPDVPLHFTRFHPTYKLKNLPSTPPSILERQFEIAKQAGIHYPYLGNLPGHEGESTRCHHCGELVIRRVGFTVVENKLRDGSCSACEKTVPGVWS